MTTRKVLVHLPDTNEVVTVSSEEGLAISAPCEGQALRGISPGTSGHLIR